MGTAATQAESRTADAPAGLAGARADGPDRPGSGDDAGADSAGDEPRRSGRTDAGASVEVLVEVPDVEPSVGAWLKDYAARAAAALGCAGDIRVRIVGDREMARVHERHMDAPGTTDVITFDLSGGASADGAPLDVDLLLCADEARRQSLARGIEIERELLLYAIHGILHCLGHDDHEPEAFGRMHELEDRILVRLGLPAAYAQGERNRET